ncbi:MAG TPA: cupredoxin domain-containing protein, partial [Acidiferrobacterales bacterium]|nr:cupredoxin domain-containing protein [Acidiferrobacterales bacterium]
GSKASTGTLAFKVANTDTRPHEFVVMKWLPDSQMEQSIGRIGPLQPGTSATMTLTDLTPGRYVILCNMLDTDGLPYSSKGMRTEFTIQ